jgi:hypothetical protein
MTSVRAQQCWDLYSIFVGSIGWEGRSKLVSIEVPAVRLLWSRQAAILIPAILEAGNYDPALVCATEAALSATKYIGNGGMETILLGWKLFLVLRLLHPSQALEMLSLQETAMQECINAMKLPLDNFGIQMWLNVIETLLMMAIRPLVLPREDFCEELSRNVMFAWLDSSLSVEIIDFSGAPSSHVVNGLILAEQKHDNDREPFVDQDAPVCVAYGCSLPASLVASDSSGSWLAVLLQLQVTAILCQKVVHPLVRSRLRGQRIAVIERIGLRRIQTVCQLTGAALLPACNATLSDANLGRSLQKLGSISLGSSSQSCTVLYPSEMSSTNLGISISTLVVAWPEASIRQDVLAAIRRVLQTLQVARQDDSPSVLPALGKLELRLAATGRLQHWPEEVCHVWEQFGEMLSPSGWVDLEEGKKWEEKAYFPMVTHRLEIEQALHLARRLLFTGPALRAS